MKRILYVYHRLDIIGGIETRWKDEFEFLRKNEIEPLLLLPDSKIRDEVASFVNPDQVIRVYDYDNSNIDNLTVFINLVNQIVEIINSKHIEAISIHTNNLFSCAALIASQLSQIPSIATNHGITNHYVKPIERIFINGFASKSLGLSCHISKALAAISNHPDNLLAVIPNLINLDQFQSSNATPRPAWLIVNRISKEKYPSILRFLQAAEYCKIPEVDIAGGGNPEALRALIKANKINIEVNFLGQVDDIPSLIPSYSGVAGVGRVVVEALACHKPVCISSITGELIGLVTRQNFDSLKSFNFTGKGCAPIKDVQFLNQLNSYNLNQSREIYSLIKTQLSVSTWDNYIHLYKNVTFIDNKALQALYYKMSYYSNAVSTPFLEDEFFVYLLKETLMEFKLKSLLEELSFYENTIGLNSVYPSPFETKKLRTDIALNLNTRIKRKIKQVVKLF